MKSSLLASLGLLIAGCGGDPAIVSVTATPTTVAPGGTIAMVVEVENVDLAEDHHAALTARALTVRHEEGEEGAGIHLHTYLDDTETNPLAQTSSTSYSIVIPGATAAGAHQLIVRIHGADHTILTPEVKASVAITVQ